MICRSLALTALAASTVSAILIPPSITAADLLGDDSSMEITVDPMKRTVALECPTCAFATKNDKVLEWQKDAGNSFLVDFEVGSNEDTLQIEGVQLYPPTFGYFASPFYVTQVDPTAGEPLRLRVTGYNFHYSSAETVTEAGIELLPMTFRITSIEGQSVNPPALTVNLLKDTNGRLMIASFQTATTDDVSENKECNDWPLMCILRDRINGIKTSVAKGCHMRKMHKGEKPHHMPGEFRPGHPHHRPHPRPHHNKGAPGYPHHHNHHGHHGPEGHHHRMHMFMRRAFFTILIPILIGVFAGTLTYLVGMALGCVIAMVVAKVRGQSAYERIALDEEEAEHMEEPTEKEAYAELPTYDAPPVYEEAAEKEVVADSEETK